jgi:hypothetical protein
LLGSYGCSCAQDRKARKYNAVQCRFLSPRRRSRRRPCAAGRRRALSLLCSWQAPPLPAECSAAPLRIPRSRVPDTTTRLAPNPGSDLFAPTLTCDWRRVCSHVAAHVRHVASSTGQPSDDPDARMSYRQRGWKSKKEVARSHQVRPALWRDQRNSWPISLGSFEITGRG